MTVARRVPRHTWKTITDAKNGFHSIPLRESDRHLTTFITPYGRWRYKRGVQGYVSSGDAFNRRFDAILTDFPKKERLMDDTLHYDEDLESKQESKSLTQLVGPASVPTGLPKA